jgi:NAD-dependent dihydropyrimidine dehydrogenase PreA subunit
MKTTIYYFTGTGNSLEVAKDLGALLAAEEPQPIAALRDQETVTPEGETIGLVFPVYDWNMPAIVERFIKRLDLTGVNYIFAVATCNFLPGGALDRLDLLLRESGKKLSGGFVIRMPGNYLCLYGANSERIQRWKFRRKDAAVKRIAELVSSGREARIEHPGLLFDRLFAHKFYKEPNTINQCDQSFWVDPERCTRCGICQKVCPVQNIEYVNGTPQWLHGCEQCFACIQLCPKEAIQYGKNTEGRKRYKNPRITMADLYVQAQRKSQ